MADLIINDETSNDILFPEAFGRGHDPTQRVPGMFGALPSTIRPIPKSDWIAVHRENQERKVGLKFMRRTGANGSKIPSLDQNGQGYCWSYSIIGGVIYARLKAGQPYVRLSPHAVACKVKN